MPFHSCSFELLRFSNSNKPKKNYYYYSYLQKAKRLIQERQLLEFYFIVRRMIRAVIKRRCAYNHDNIKGLVLRSPKNVLCTWTQFRKKFLACTLSELGQGFGLLQCFRELIEVCAGLEKRGLAKYLGASERCFKVILVAKSIRVISFREALVQ